jgi:hypothetical protein
MKDFKVVFVSRPSVATAAANATVLGVLGVVPDLARKLGVDIEHVTVSLCTKAGQIVSARLERNDRENA